MNEDGINIEKFSPHTFRHTFATRAIENGMNPKVLQQIMGHGTLQMTMDLYCHVFDKTLFDEMKKMEKKFIVSLENPLPLGGGFSEFMDKVVQNNKFCKSFVILHKFN